MGGPDTIRLLEEKSTSGPPCRDLASVTPSLHRDCNPTVNGCKRCFNVTCCVILAWIYQTAIATMAVCTLVSICGSNRLGASIVLGCILLFVPMVLVSTSFWRQIGSPLCRSGQAVCVSLMLAAWGFPTSVGWPPMLVPLGCAATGLTLWSVWLTAQLWLLALNNSVAYFGVTCLATSVGIVGGVLISYLVPQNPLITGIVFLLAFLSCLTDWGAELESTCYYRIGRYLIVGSFAPLGEATSTLNGLGGAETCVSLWTATRHHRRWYWGAFICGIAVPTGWLVDFLLGEAPVVGTVAVLVIVTCFQYGHILGVVLAVLLGRSGSVTWVHRACFIVLMIVDAGWTALVQIWPLIGRVGALTTSVGLVVTAMWVELSDATTERLVRSRMSLAMYGALCAVCTICCIWAYGSPPFASRQPNNTCPVL